MTGFKVLYCIVHGTKDAAVLIWVEYMWTQAATPCRSYCFLLASGGGHHDLFSDPTAEDPVQFTVDYIKKYRCEEVNTRTDLDFMVCRRQSSRQWRTCTKRVSSNGRQRSEREGFSRDGKGPSPATSKLIWAPFVK
jgi:hypothetical protein